MTAPRDVTDDAPYRFVTIHFSHYCEKARWALDRLGVPYREEGYLPVVHYLGTLPAAQPHRAHPRLAGGDLRRLDRHPALPRRPRPARRAPLPRGAGSRREVEELEDGLRRRPRPARAPLGLQPHPARARARRGVLRQGPRRRPRTSGSAPLCRHRGAPSTSGSRSRRPAWSARSRGWRRPSRSSSAASRTAAASSRATVPAADLTFASLATPRSCPRRSVISTRRSTRSRPRWRRHPGYRARPAGAFALRLYREERRRVVGG